MLLKEYGKAKGRVISAFNLEPVRNTMPRENGEYRLIDFLSRCPEIRSYDSVVDIGANVGDWTAQAIATFSPGHTLKYFCVEPIPEFAGAIRERFQNHKEVRVIDLIFSNASSESAEIFKVAGGGSMYRNYSGNTVRDRNSTTSSTKKIVSHRIPVSTGDKVLGELGVNPYLIKIDCDGHDLHVLQGLRGTISRRRPVIQFEYSDFWIGAQSRLRDACSLLKSAGYNTFKVFHDKLVRFRFNPLFETFGYQNILAAPKEFSSISGKLIPLAAA